MTKEPRYWIDDPRNVTTIFRALVAVCLALGAADFLYHKHVHFAWESWPAFYGLYGFVACYGLVLAAKYLRRILMRDEDYYDR